MIVRTRVFELSEGRYINLSELAEAMEISVSQVYRVREGKRQINQKFIVGAVKAFPNHNLDDLFYLSPKMPAVTNSRWSSPLAAHPAEQSVAKKKNRTHDRVLN